MRRRMTPKFWLFMIFSMLIVFSVSFGLLQHRYHQDTVELARVSEYRDDLILQVRDLNAALEYAQTDDFIIRSARDNLGYIMPGEVRYVNGAG